MMVFDIGLVKRDFRITHEGRYVMRNLMAAAGIAVLSISFVGLGYAVQRQGEASGDPGQASPSLSGMGRIADLNMTAMRQHGQAEKEAKIRRIELGCGQGRKGT